MMKHVVKMMAVAIMLAMVCMPILSSCGDDEPPGGTTKPTTTTGGGNGAGGSGGSGSGSGTGSGTGGNEDEYTPKIGDVIEVNSLYYKYSKKTGENNSTFTGFLVTKNPNGSYNGTIVIPSSFIYKNKNFQVYGIDDCAFERNSIIEVVLPSTEQFYLGELAFNDSDLKSISFPEYSGCHLTLSLPEGLGTGFYIPLSCFAGCESLSSVKLPNSLVAIGNCAFYQCTSLKSITIPESVKKVGHIAFLRSGITTLYYNAKNCFFDLDFKVTDVTDLWNGSNDQSFNGTLEKCIIGPYVESLPEGFLCNAVHLTSVEMSDKVTDIGEGAFAGCEFLKTINLSKSLTSLKRYTFWNCRRLESITIPDNVTKIEYAAFDYCDFATVVLGKKVNEIENGAFYGITNCYSYNPVAPHIYVDGLGGSFRRGIAWLHVPQGCDSYDNWGYGPGCLRVTQHITKDL